jgi:hypothetical protein
VPVLDQRGVQASAFGLHTRQQDPSKLVQRGLSGDPNLAQHDARLIDGAGPDLIGLSLGQPQGALRARTEAALARLASPLGMKLGQNGSQLLLGKVNALPVDDGCGGELIDVGLDSVEIATEFVEVGIDLGTVIASDHPIEARWTGRRARQDPVTGIGDLPRRVPALLRSAGCSTHPPSSSATCRRRHQPPTRVRWKVRSAR